MPYFKISKDDVALNVTDNKNKNTSLIEITVNLHYLKEKLHELENITISEISENMAITKREVEILKCLSQGKQNKEIAQNMNISVHTVKVHIHNIFSKLSSTDRTEAVIKAIKARLINV